jgi:hypothetical protein
MDQVTQSDIGESQKERGGIVVCIGIPKLGVVLCCHHFKAIGAPAGFPLVYRQFRPRIRAPEHHHCQCPFWHFYKP